MTDEIAEPTAAVIETALVRGASPTTVARAAEALAGLAERATTGDPAAYAAYHAQLFDLHERDDPHTQATRRWLCHAAYEVEEAHLLRTYADDPRVHLAEAAALPLRERIIAELEARSGLRHPMSVHLFEGTPTLHDLLVYLEHHWYRSRGFFRELTEFALGLPRPEASVVVANLHEELGEGVPERAHPQLLWQLLVHLGVPSSLLQRPSWPQAHAYLNNRVRCARSGEPAWGLAVMFALEHGTPATHGSLYRLLQRLGVPEPLLEFHRIHMLGDAAHAEAFLEQIERLVVTPTARRKLMISLVHHRALGMRYFDRIWQEIQRPEAP